MLNNSSKWFINFRRHAAQSFKFPAIYISSVHKILILLKAIKFKDWLIEDPQAPISLQSHHHDSEVQRVFQKMVKRIGSFSSQENQSSALFRQIKVPHFFVISTRVSNDLNLPSRSSKGVNHVFISRLLLFGLSICANGPSKRSSFRMYVSTSASEPVFSWSYTLHCVHRFNFISY